MFSNFKHNKMSSLLIKSDTIISISICMHSKKTTKNESTRKLHTCQPVGGFN